MTAIPSSTPQGGVLYTPNLPWLPLSGHELVEQLREARDELTDHPDDPGAGEELERLSAIYQDHAKMRLLPMSQAEYQRARQTSKAIRQSVKMKGTAFVLEDQISAETELALELIGKRVIEVQQLEVVAEDGTRTPITTGPALVEVLRTMSAGHAAALIEDLHQAIKTISHLEKGLGEVLPSRFAS